MSTQKNSAAAQESGSAAKKRTEKGGTQSVKQLPPAVKEHLDNNTAIAADVAKDFGSVAEMFDAMHANDAIHYLRTIRGWRCIGCGSNNITSYGLKLYNYSPRTYCRECQAN